MHQHETRNKPTSKYLAAFSFYSPPAPFPSRPMQIFHPKANGKTTTLLPTLPSRPTEVSCRVNGACSRRLVRSPPALPPWRDVCVHITSLLMGEHVKVSPLLRASMGEGLTAARTSHHLHGPRGDWQGMGSRRKLRSSDAQKAEIILPASPCSWPSPQGSLRAVGRSRVAASARISSTLLWLTGAS
jgi:hypothetical protein